MSKSSSSESGRVNKLALNDFLRRHRTVAGLFALTCGLILTLAGCGGTDGAGTPSQPAAQPTARPAWAIDCTAHVTVERGDTVLGSIKRKAQQQCPKMSNNDLSASFGVMGRNMNQIQEGETLSLNDYANE